jgi:D-serine deaminase-like pyridoxal phosphate-dependent protein
MVEINDLIELKYGHHCRVAELFDRAEVLSAATLKIFHWTS